MTVTVTVAAGQPGDVNIWLPRGQTGRVYDVAVVAYSPGQWVNFAIGLARADGGLYVVAAALVLAFGTSPRRHLDPVHRDRAGRSDRTDRRGRTQRRKLTTLTWAVTQAAVAGAGRESVACGSLRPGIVLAASASRMDSEHAKAHRQITAATRKAVRYAVRLATVCPRTR